MSDLQCGFSPSKARGKRPVPMWADRFLRDTMELSAEEIGAYHLVLYAMWKRPDCSLPADSKKLARIARVSVRKWNSQIGPSILPLMDELDGVLTSKKLTEEARQTEQWCTAQHVRKCEACKLSRDKSNFSDAPSFGRKDIENPGKSLKTNDPRLTGDTTRDEPGNLPGINHPKDPTYMIGDDAGTRETDDLPFPDDGNQSVPNDVNLRGRLLVVCKVDPQSGLTGHGGQMLGTASDMLVVSRWKSDLQMTDDEIVTVAAEVIARKPDGPPNGFSYFSKAMARYAGQRDQQALSPITPTATTGGSHASTSRNGPGNSIASVAARRVAELAQGPDVRDPVNQPVPSLGGDHSQRDGPGDGDGNLRLVGRTGYDDDQAQGH
ncbi:hypothetical protein GCM10007385_35330 [Tateyamaria omphalii]|uniref:DUF1376 domain-containing protein n=1 Tax=Tateyamaria omphalii TaxID=299262 RepID=UPI0016741801|nr:DUF1376 domain-containing protein [Tateyamaria omphalii]GGX63134.1 hypothetical protein GCM10007385_35330 [Tateyamaria omphalii]